MQEQRSEAIVLGHLDYGEADRIVTFYTPDQGLLKGFARGARKSRRRFGAALEPFARIRLHWAQSRGGLAALREAELIDLHAGLRSDLVALALAGYGCELVETFCGEGQGHGEAFGLLGAFLDHLDRSGGSRQARLLIELRVLALAGYVPHFLHCSECGASLEGGPVDFEAARGGSLCAACRTGGGGVRVDLRTLGTLARSLKVPVDRFEGFRLSARTQEEGGKILANALQPHLPRPLKTLPFLERILAGEAPR
ncbi:MAG: DNA repair protein RecO [Desulfuromonas sp.]|uniref:DNA repair protein RecO n=1 Tax=Desulfuromonas sp. TaxID=892 RepID=UPI000CC7F725|nr:DNA repair protein RecO [Desulfuromonas sp.]PLX85307.1 MAG: DNA repair protein RecO [Desulfuromonas sp.]